MEEIQEPITFQLVDFHSNSPLNTLLRKFISTEQARKKSMQNLRLDALKLLEYDSDCLELLLENCSDEKKLLLIDDEELMMKAVSLDGRLLERASSRLKNHYGLVLAAVKQNGMLLSDISDEYWTRDLVLEAVKEDGQALDIEWHQVNEEIVMEAVKSNGLVLQDFYPEYLNEEFINEACKENPFARDGIDKPITVTYIANNAALYCGISLESIRDYISKDVLYEVMKNHPESHEYLLNLQFQISNDEYFELTKTALKYSGEIGDLNISKDLTIEDYEELAKIDGDVLYMVNEYDQTREMILNAIQNNGSLEYVNRELCDDYFIVMEAIKKDPSAINYSHELYYNREVILDYVKENGEVLAYVYEDYGNDREIVLNAVMNYGLALEFASQELKEDEEIVMAAISNCGLALEFASMIFRNRRDRSDVLLKAVSQNGLALKFAYAQNRDIVFHALNQCIFAFEFADKELVTEDILLMVVKKCPNLYPIIRSRYNHGRDVTLCAVEGFGGNLCHAPEELKKDREIVLAAVRSSGCALSFADEKLRDDYEIVRSAILNNPFSLAFGSKRLRLDLRLTRLSKELKDADLNRFNSWEDIHQKRDRSSQCDEDEEDEYGEFSPQTKILKVD